MGPGFDLPPVQLIGCGVASVCDRLASRHKGAAERITVNHMDNYLAGLSIEERNETLDQWAAEEAADSRAEEPGAWQIGQNRYERALGW
jgi:3,4-dihydroxy-2-butanone 4-phosphate synthase